MYNGKGVCPYCGGYSTGFAQKHTFGCQGEVEEKEYWKQYSNPKPQPKNEEPKMTLLEYIAQGGKVYGMCT